MTFGEVAMPAAGASTAEDAQAISVDSIATEEEKKPSNQSAAQSSSRHRATSLPKTSSQTRTSSTGQSIKSGEKRPSKSVMPSRLTIKKVKDREPLSSPEQPKSRSSSRSIARRASRDKSASPSSISRRSAQPTPPSQTKENAASNLAEGDTADMALDRAIQGQREHLSSNPPALNLVGHQQATSNQLIQQLRYAEEKMRIAHQEDLSQYEEITMGLITRMNEMAQEDQGSAMRIEELERHRGNMGQAMRHMNQVHQQSLEDHQPSIERIEEESHAQHRRDEEVSTSLHQELTLLRSEAAQTFAQMEQHAQGEGQQLAMEYSRLVEELNEKAHETLHFKMEASQIFSTLAIMKEQMELMKNEENMMRDEANRRMSFLETGAHELRNSLNREERAKSEVATGFRPVEMASSVESGTSLSALRSEVGELRRRLRQQEEFQARNQQAWKQEIELARRQHHVPSQPPSSMPLSSKTSDAGWEYVQSQSQSSQKGISCSRGSEVRSPEVSSSNVPSPINRGKVSTDGTTNVPNVVNDEYMGDSADALVTRIAEDARNVSRFGTFLASGGYGTGTTQGQVSERANALRGAQLQDLLRHQGMWRPTMPSSSSSRRQPNIFKEHDDEEDQRLISHLVSEDVRAADEERAQERDQREKLEAERLHHMDELRSELQRAKENEDRIRGEREYWRQEAEYYYKQENHQGDDYDEGEEEEAVPPSESPTNLGPNGPGDGDGSKKSPTHRGGPAGGDPPGPPSDIPTDEGVADVTEVKISRREADKVIVPPFPRVTHLDSWMSFCIANVLGACADPNHEEWIAWLNPAFRPNPDIDALNDSGHIKFKSIDINLGIAMSAMLKAAGDVALDLYLDVNRKSSKYVREESKLIKGRQIIAMMYESFRTRDRLDMIVTLEYLIKLQYQGDNHMSVFKQTWLECIDRMRPEDVPSNNALRDTLYAKTKVSPALKMELLVSYDMLNYDDPKRAYQHLLHLMDRCIQRSREQKMLKQTQNGLQLMIQGKDTLSAMAAKTKGSESATPAPKKPTKPPKNESW